jgi:hypothetical protein
LAPISDRLGGDDARGGGHIFALTGWAAIFKEGGDGVCTASCRTGWIAPNRFRKAQALRIDIVGVPRCRPVQRLLQV